MFINLSGLLKPFGLKMKVKDVNIYYNMVFKMHTKLTVYFLLIFFIFVSAHGYFGQPINCMIDDKNNKYFAEISCWVLGTFQMRNSSTIDAHRKLEREYQKNYQWISIVLLLQAVIFYLPACMWKNWEHSRLKQLCGSLGSSVATENYQKDKNKLVGYWKCNNSKIHGVYVRRFIVCEIMNFLMVIINMSVLNAIFNQFWYRYFPAVWSLLSTSNGETFSSLASDLFPKSAKCEYTKYGPSGSTENRDSLCVLSLNILNEKIFAFLYVWYILLLIASGCNLMVRSVVLMSQTLRLKMMRELAISAESFSYDQLRLIFHLDNIGDWFVLYSIGSNINPFVFREILDDIADCKGSAYKGVLRASDKDSLNNGFFSTEPCTSGKNRRLNIYSCKEIIYEQALPA